MSRRRQPTFLKWAGNKSRIAPQILARLPAGQRLVEPFAGSAALSLISDYPTYLLADTNADLIDLFRRIQQEGETFIRYCATLFTDSNNQPDRYYALRDQFNQLPVGEHQRTALFLYLNRHGYNGLCRYNSKGIYNVPFGRYTRPYFPAQEMLRFHRRAEQTEICLGDFTTVLERTRPGDVVYCDPPYVPASLSANFTQYHIDGFDLADQRRLAEAAAATAARGVPVLISNHYNDFTATLYANAEVTTLDVGRQISCDPTNRNKVAEVLALYAVSAP